jgi:hypothetical protein
MRQPVWVNKGAYADDQLRLIVNMKPLSSFVWHFS